MVLEAIKACTTQAITVQQVKSKYCTLKQDWEAWKAYRPHWGWDFENGVPIGPLEVLKAFSEESSETALFRTRPLLDGAVATIGHILSREVLQRTHSEVTGFRFCQQFHIWLALH